MSKTNRLQLHKLAKIVISTLVALMVIYLLSKHFSEFTTLFKTIDLKSITGVLATQIVLIAIVGYPFKAIFKVLGFNIPFKEWISLSYASNLANHLAPFRPGLAIRYIYMKSRYGSSLKEMALVSVAYSFYMTLTAYLLVLLYLPFIQPPLVNSYALVVIGVFGLICGVTSIYLLNRFANRISWIPTKLKNFIAEVSKIIVYKKLTISTIFQFILINLLSAIVFYLAFKAFSVEIRIDKLLLIAALTTLSSLINLTPGNIGISETVVGLVSSYDGGEFHIGFMVMSVVRVCHLLVSIALGSFSTAYLMSNTDRVDKTTSNNS